MNKKKKLYKKKNKKSYLMKTLSSMLTITKVFQKVKR